MPQFRLGPQQQIILGSDWKKIHTLDQRKFAWSIGIAVGMGLVAAWIWRTCFDESLPLGVPSWMEILLTIAICTVGHELLHMLGFPSLGLSSNTVIGFWPQAASPYVQYLCTMSRDRFLIVVLLPFFVLSILPFVFAAHGIGSLKHLSWISVINCIGAGSDILIAIQVVRSIPQTTKVVESGDSLCWKE